MCVSQPRAHRGSACTMATVPCVSGVWDRGGWDRENSVGVAGAPKRATPSHLLVFHVPGAGRARRLSACSTEEVRGEAEGPVDHLALAGSQKSRTSSLTLLPLLGQV